MNQVAAIALAAAIAAASGGAATPSPKPKPPAIDVHRHAPRLGADDESARLRALRSMDENNIVRSLLYINEPSDLDDWLGAAPGRFIASVALPCWRNRDDSYYCFPVTGGWPDLEWLERELASGRVRALGEMLFNYSGVRPDDERMWPYWALAAKYDVPIFVHTGRGPGPGQGPREDPGCCVNYDGNLGNPELLRPVLERYPNLRIALLHFGAGDPQNAPYFRDEALALMRDYPSVYVDQTVLSSFAPPEVYEAEVRGLIEAGFGKRIMFGTDNLPPEPILERLAGMRWLTDEQRSDILHDNAERFLRLQADNGEKKGAPREGRPSSP